MSGSSGRFMQVPRRALLLFAGALWIFAGTKIVNQGIHGLTESSPSTPVVFIVAGVAAAVYFLFIRFVFGPLYFRHRERIILLEEETAPALSFFDLKGWIVLAFMMALGITLRRTGLIAPLYLGTFYMGLGTALFTGGLFFLKGFMVYHRVRARLLANKG